MEIKSRARSASDLSAYNWPTDSELLLNNSRTNTQETMKMQLYPSYSFQLSAIALKKSRQWFDCNASVYMYFLHL